MSPSPSSSSGGGGGGSNSGGEGLSGLKPFVFGGVAACVAEAATFPIDTAKTRLQLQGQRTEAKHAPRVLYSGMFNCWVRIVEEEGVAVLYKGLSPALLRQATYGAIKFGLYYSIKTRLPGDESSLKNIASAVIAGAVSSAVATPTDVLKVRMQSRSSADLVSGKGVVQAFRDIFEKEGLRGLWRGVVPTAQRAAIVAGVQLPVYDFTKLSLHRHLQLEDGPVNHLVSSVCAGLCACLASSPVDVVRTRLMNQRKLLLQDKEKGQQQQQIYRSSTHCAVVTVKTEGARALFKGFVPSFMRMGPWNIIFFTLYERLKIVFPDS